MKNRKLIVYISTSLDGYIAKPNEDLSFLNRVMKKGEDYGYTHFISTVDCVIVGRKTYDWVMNQVSIFPHHTMETYIITHRVKPKEGNIHFYSGSLKDLVIRLKKEDGKNIFCDGGAEIVNELLKEELVDEVIISVAPVLVGNGTRLFQDGRPEQEVELVAVKQFDTGLVQYHYKTVKR